MAFRGRGRGRGRGFGVFAKQEKFELFPEIELPDRKVMPLGDALIKRNMGLLSFWKGSAYHLEESISKQNENLDLERFDDWEKPKKMHKRDSFLQYLQLDNFPQELTRDSRREQPSKRVRWDTNTDLPKDFFEKLEQKEKFFENQEEKDGNEKKEGEEDEEDEAAEEEEAEFSDDGDYNQNEDFDDDEDDFNMDDGHDDEPTY